MSDGLKLLIGFIFTVSGGVILTLFTIGLNKFIGVCNKILDHDFKIDLLSKKMDDLKDEVILVNEEGVKMLAQELHPLNGRVEKVELDIHKIKKHTKYPE